MKVRQIRETLPPGGSLSRVALVLLFLTLVMLMAVQSPISAQQGGTCNDLLVLVDKQHRLSPSYVPPDLVYPYYYGVPTTGYGELLRQEAAVNLSQMVADARASGVELALSDGWRSYWTQQSLYNYWANVYGPGARGVSAPPGASMHQLGTAVDLTNAYASYGVNYYFGYSDAYYWLIYNARYYGFILEAARIGT